jgi:hypothetical protein
MKTTAFFMLVSREYVYVLTKMISTTEVLTYKEQNWHKFQQNLLPSEPRLEGR